MEVDQREVGSLQKVLRTFFLVCSLPGLAGALAMGGLPRWC